MGDRLIEGGTVVTMDPDIEDFERADVLIEDGRITEIGPGIDHPSAEVVDASGSIVMPGFVNAHVHVYQTLIRGIAGDWTMGDYQRRVHGPLDRQYRPDDMYLAALFGGFEAIDSGVTTILDWCHVVNTPDHADRSIDGLEDAGIRAVFAYGPPAGEDRSSWWDDSTRTHPDDIRRVREERPFDDDARVRLAMAMRGPAFTTQEVAERDLELARDLNVLASMHVGHANFADNGEAGLNELADDGLLGPDVNCVHANDLAPATFERLAAADASITTTPEVELQMGLGYPATRKALDAGFVPSLGTDIPTGVSGDMIPQIRSALQTHRGLDHADAYEAGEPLETLPFDVRTAMEAATIGGARDLGLGDEVGSLTPGKRADVQVIRADDVNTAPGHDPLETVLFLSNPGNVETVLVDGEVRKRDGEIVAPAAEERRDEFATAGRRILREANLRG